MNNKTNVEKVLILSCGTGGGHNSAAKAVKESLEEKGLEVDFIEYLDIVNPRIRKEINNLYIRTTKGNGKIFKVVYKLGEMYQKTNLKSPVYALYFLNKKKLYQYIKENNYKYVITTHLFAAQALTAIKKEHNIKFMQIATDYVCIPFWEETNPDYFIIPHEEDLGDIDENENIIDLWQPLELNIDKNYEYVPTDKLFLMASNCIYIYRANWD